jgi:hypothetical protein
MTSQINQKSKKKNPNWARNKEAFDKTLQSYRSAQDTGVGASNWSESTATAKNPARPGLMEFRAEVELVVESILKTYEELFWFYSSYVTFDSEDELEREIFSEKMLGKKRIMLEQRIGRAFIKKAIFPVKTYFNSIRRSRFETV